MKKYRNSIACIFEYLISSVIDTYRSSCEKFMKKDYTTILHA